LFDATANHQNKLMQRIHPALDATFHGRISLVRWPDENKGPGPKELASRPLKEVLADC